MDRPARRGATILLLTAAGALLLDQVTKSLAVAALRDGPYDLIPGVLTFRYATNTGGAFSVFTDASWFFAAASLIVCTLLVLAAFRARPVWQSVAMGLVLGGALGNLADRALRGSGLSGDVVDFIDVHVWPVFNLADSAIVLGAIALAVGSLRGHEAPRSDAEDD